MSVSKYVSLAILTAATLLCGCNSHKSTNDDTTCDALDDSMCIVVDTTFHNIGQVGYADILSLSNLLTNHGSKVVNITKVDTDCSCLTATPSQEAIAPGESVKLSIEFDTRGNFGKQYHLIDIITDNGQNIKIYVFADIADPN